MLVSGEGGVNKICREGDGGGDGGGDVGGGDGGGDGENVTVSFTELTYVKWASRLAATPAGATQSL